MDVTGFVKSTASVKGVVNNLLVFLSALGGLWYICDVFVAGGDPLHPLIWACTVTFFALVMFTLFSYCAYAQMMMQEEIDRVTKVKKEFETLLLKRRLSSEGGKK
jgi:uncharacterized membrane protein